MTSPQPHPLTVLAERCKSAAAGLSYNDEAPVAQAKHLLHEAAAAMLKEASRARPLSERAAFLEVDAGVRYWEDGELNGEPDTEGKVPKREGDRWRPVIHLAEGRVLDWPQGVAADLSYKVCDDGAYWLQDADGERIAKWAGDYVPNAFLCHGTDGFGDYIILSIYGDGRIAKYRRAGVVEGEWDTTSFRWSA